jgi:hypothetical protein
VLFTTSPYSYNCHNIKCIPESSNPNKVCQGFYKAYENRAEADFDTLYEGYDAASGWIPVAFYKDLLAKYPNAKVILTERPAEHWYQSMRNTFFNTIANFDVGPDHPHYELYRLTVTLTLDGALLHPEKFDDEAFFKQKFLDHNEEVKRLVPAEQLYVMQIGEGWEGVCKFLGKDVPDLPYPNQNNAESFRQFIKVFGRTNETKSLEISSLK